MRLEQWEVTIQKIIEECNHEKKGVGRRLIEVHTTDRVLAKWRAQLEKEPTLLQPFQIDEIVREVRRKLGNPNR
jgi:hypothetical protein